jgi:integrase
LAKTPDMARKTLARVRRILDWATIRGYRNVMVGNISIPLPNPCVGIRSGLGTQPAEGNHAAIPYPDLPEFIKTFRSSNAGSAVKLAMEFTILTAARTSEVLNARWDEFDLKGRMWSVPAGRMKMDREHKVPLSDRCLEILNAAKELDDKDIVFASSKPGTSLSNTAMLMALRRMGRGDLTVHGFRATFKTWAEEKTKFDTLVIESSMAHAVKGIERHYLRTTFFDERKKLMSAWAAYTTGTPTSKIAKFRA